MLPSEVVGGKLGGASGVSSLMGIPLREARDLPTACPVKALMATACKRLYPPNSRVRAMLASP